MFFVITFGVTLETDAMERPADQRTYALIKKKIEFSSYIRKFRVEQLQSEALPHI